MIEAPTVYANEHARYVNPDAGITAMVLNYPGRFVVVLRDDDAGLEVGRRQYPDIDAADAYARKLVA